MSVNSPPHLLVYGVVSDEKEHACPGPQCVAVHRTCFDRHGALQEKDCFCSRERKKPEVPPKGKDYTFSVF